MKTNNNLIFIGEFQPCNEKYYNPLHGDCITDSIILQNNITYKSSVTKYITGHVINDKIIINTDYVNTDNNDSLLLSCNNSNSTVTNDTCTTTTTTTSSTGITSRRMMMIKHETQISFISKPWQYIHDNNWNKVKKKIISYSVGNVKNILKNYKNCFINNDTKLIIKNFDKILFKKYHYFNSNKFLWKNIMKTYYNIFLKI